MAEDYPHPMDPRHPDHPDNHHLRLAHPHAGIVRAVLGIFVLVVLALMFAIGLLTNAPFGSVLLAFTPSVLLGLFGLGLLNADIFDLRYMLIVLVILLVIIPFVLPLLTPNADPAAAMAINLVLGAVLLLVLSQSHVGKVESRVVEYEEDIPTMIATIEDRCKAINFVVGRVYSVHHGATAGMRDKIKIDPQWYNDLSAAMEDPEKNKNILRGVIERIKRRLEQLHEHEATVFTKAEVSRLKKLERKTDGKTRILDVLAENDSDPVEQYVASAEEYCGIAMDQLQD